jgi:uncharacterized protein YecE (DUF72 family)
MDDYRIGTMTFSEKTWLGSFYPPGTRPSEYLTFYSTQFNALEIDATYHAVPDPSRVVRWLEQTPPDFRFALKTPSAVTHEGRIDRNLPAMLDFLYVARHLQEKLAVVLIQLPPSCSVSEFGPLATFLQALPTGPGQPRYAVEFRHASWRTDRVATLLADLRMARVAIDYAGHTAEIVNTTDFLYLRFIGEHGRFTVKDREQVDMTETLEWWRDRIGEQSGVKTLWALFNNDYAGHSPATARTFRQMLGIPAPQAAPRTQGMLF